MAATRRSRGWEGLAQGSFCPWGLEQAADGAGTQVFCLPCPDTSTVRAVPSTRSPQLCCSARRPRCDLPLPGADSAPNELCFHPPHTHCGCQKAPGQLLSIPQNSRALHLGDEGEGQVGSISGKQEVISLKDLGEVFPPTPSPPPKRSQPGQPEAGS